MKKLLYIGVIALGLGLMSFTSNLTEVVEVKKENGMCASLANTYFNELAQATGDIEAAHQASVEYYNACTFVYEFHATGFSLSW